MRDFIVCGNSIIDNGTVAERCFFGNATRASALTATDSLFFAGSHCDNGEACSVLAGPYTISHRGAAKTGATPTCCSRRSTAPSPR